MFKKRFAPPRFRPTINTVSMFDLFTGAYELGKHGESICNGGVSSITGICALPNNFKTHMMVFQMAMIRRACHHADNVIYDTEGTLHPVDRFNAHSQDDEYLKSIDWEQDELLAFTDISQYKGDEFFHDLREVMEERGKDLKANTRTTPFIDEKKECKTALYPSIAGFDSLSRMSTSIVEEVYEKNDIGSSNLNMEAMSNGKAKKQMFNQLPQLTARNGGYLFMTAHVKKKINMEAYPTDDRILSHMKKDTVLEGVSNGFYSLPNNLWMVTGNKPNVNKDKMPEYPWDNAHAVQGDTDMAEITITNLRGKRGMSGFPITFLISQSDGVQPYLSSFHYCKKANYFGLDGNKQNYQMTLYPDVTLSRTKIRKKLDEDPKLRRAVHITMEILMLHQFHREDYRDVLCDPETLYNGLKKMGYDWDVLLETRCYWVFKEEEKEHPLPFLSTMDLLRMRAGLYVPYWMTKEQKAAIKPLALEAPKTA